MFLGFVRQGGLRIRLRPSTRTRFWRVWEVDRNQGKIGSGLDGSRGQVRGRSEREWEEESGEGDGGVGESRLLGFRRSRQGRSLRSESRRERGGGRGERRWRRERRGR